MHGATIKAFGEPKEVLEVVNVQEPAAQPVDADPYVARVRLKFKPDGSLLKRRSSSIRRPIRRRSRRQRACCRLSRHATLYRCRVNIAPFILKTSSAISRQPKRTACFALRR